MSGESWDCCEHDRQFTEGCEACDRKPTLVHSMGPDGSGFGIKMSTDPGIIKAMLDAFKGVLEEHPTAENYVEMQLQDRETGSRYTVTIGKPGGRTPHQLRKQAEAAVLHFWDNGVQCPCGARPESPDTHPHNTGCPVGIALAQMAPTP